MSTKGFGGRTITESVWIYTNDKKNPQLQIRVTGTVEKFADISPKRVTLVGAVGTPLKKQIRIVPQEQYPFKILSTRAKDGRFITFQTEERKESEKSLYVLTVENAMQQKGRYYDVIYLDTDSKIRPVIEISVMGNILIPAGTQNKP
ncbi:MAG: hypothetical protein V2I97_01900 [Desulfococcaceae bacterium]|nr:hypothetical protein [Desulfococcaceae bacterium]